MINTPLEVGHILQMFGIIMTILVGLYIRNLDLKLDSLDKKTDQKVSKSDFDKIEKRISELDIELSKKIEVEVGRHNSLCIERVSSCKPVIQNQIKTMNGNITEVGKELWDALNHHSHVGLPPESQIIRNTK